MQLIIERKVGSDFTVTVNKNTTIAKLKMKVYRVLGISPSYQRLTYEGKELLPDKKTIKNLKIKAGSTIHLSVWSYGFGAWREI